jgi:hypothetical protein
MRLLMLSFGNKRPLNLQMAPACRGWNVLASAKFLEHAHFFHTVVSLMTSHPITFSTMPMLQDCCAVMASVREIQDRDDESIGQSVSR